MSNYWAFQNQAIYLVEGKRPAKIVQSSCYTDSRREVFGWSVIRSPIIKTNIE